MRFGVSISISKIISFPGAPGGQNQALSWGQRRTCAMSIIRDLDDSRDDSSVNTENSAASRRNSSSIGKLPSMRSHASNASHDSAPSVKAIAIDYKNLHVSSEIKELFKLIDHYEPVDIELEMPLKIFHPRYIPSVREVDPMIKIPRPDGVPDGVGTAILDEPIAANQSNAAVIELQLRNIMKNKSARAVAVRSISNAVKNRDEIDQWIRSVEEIHSMKQPPPNGVGYRNQMGKVNNQAKSEIVDKITMHSRDVHLENAHFPISSNPSLRVTTVNTEQPCDAQSLITLTAEGILMRTRDVHIKNACFPISSSPSL